MTKEHVIWLLVGALIYFGYLKFRGVVGGMPWAPVPAVKAG